MSAGDFPPDYDLPYEVREEPSDFFGSPDWLDCARSLCTPPAQANTWPDEDEGDSHERQHAPDDMPYATVLALGRLTQL